MKKTQSGSSAIIESLSSRRTDESAIKTPSVRDSALVAPSNGHAAASSFGFFVVVAPSSRIQKAAFFLLFPALCAVVAALGYLFHRLEQRDALAAANLHRFEMQIQRLGAGVTNDSERRRLLLGVRDEIMKANPQIGLHEAYRYAELLQRATEAHPTVPPLLLAALGIVESGYRADAVGPTGARGLYQLWPTSARILARTEGWEFQEQMLFDPEVNTMLAALYLDVLFAEYRAPELVLAEYHGGARNAGLLRAHAGGVADEVTTFVSGVMREYERLCTELEMMASKTAD